MMGDLKDFEFRVPAHGEAQLADPLMIARQFRFWNLALYLLK